MTEFIREQRIKATRKPHRCEGCGKMIEAGQPAVAYAQKSEGELYSGHFHTDCRDAEVAWNHEADTWGEDWSPLCSIRECDDADDWLAWLAEKFPAVHSRIEDTPNA